MINPTGSVCVCVCVGLGNLFAYYFPITYNNAQCDI